MQGRAGGWHRCRWRQPRGSLSRGNPGQNACLPFRLRRDCNAATLRPSEFGIAVSLKGILELLWLEIGVRIVGHALISRVIKRFARNVMRAQLASQIVGKYTVSRKQALISGQQQQQKSHGTRMTQRANFWSACSAAHHAAVRSCRGRCCGCSWPPSSSRPRRRTSPPSWIVGALRLSESGGDR